MTDNSNYTNRAILQTEQDSPYFGKDPVTLSSYEKLMHRSYQEGNVFQADPSADNFFEDLDEHREQFRRANLVKQMKSELELDTIILTC